MHWSHSVLHQCRFFETQCSKLTCKRHYLMLEWAWDYVCVSEARHHSWITMIGWDTLIIRYMALHFNYQFNFNLVCKNSWQNATYQWLKQIKLYFFHWDYSTVYPSNCFWYFSDFLFFFVFSFSHYLFSLWQSGRLSWLLSFWVYYKYIIIVPFSHTQRWARSWSRYTCSQPTGEFKPPTLR